MTRLAPLALAGLLALPSAAQAANCGDTAGAFGQRLACACGDAVVTDTRLRRRDPIVRGVCPGNGLTIAASEITLHCGNRKLRGAGEGSGVLVQNGLRGITIKRCKVFGFERGIDLPFGFNGVIERNRIKDNEIGLFAIDAWDSEIKRNIFARNGLGMRLVESVGVQLGQNKITRSTGTGLLLVRVDQFSVIRNKLNRNRAGVFADEVANSTFLRNKMNRNDGVGAEVGGQSWGNQFIGNRAKRNGAPGFLVQGFQNTFTGNVATSPPLDGPVGLSEPACPFDDGRNFDGGGNEGLCER